MHLQCRRPWFASWVGKICWRRDRPTPVFLGFPCGSSGKESACNAGDLGLIPRLGRSPGEGKGYPLHYSGLENSMNCMVHGVTKSQAQLSDFHFHFLLSQKAIPSVSCNSNLRHHRIRNPKCFSYHCRWKQTAGVFSWIFYSWPNHTFLYGIPSPNKRGVTKRHSTVSLI